MATERSQSLLSREAEAGVQAPACEMVSPTFRMGPLTSISPIYKLLHKRARKFVSQGTVDPGTLTVDINHHNTRLLCSKFFTIVHKLDSLCK